MKFHKTIDVGEGRDRHRSYRAGRYLLTRTGEHKQCVLWDYKSYAVANANGDIRFRQPAGVFKTKKAANQWLKTRTD